MCVFNSHASNRYRGARKLQNLGFYSVFNKLLSGWKTDQIKSLQTSVGSEVIVRGVKNNKVMFMWTEVAN